MKPENPVAKGHQIAFLTRDIKALEAKLLSNPKHFRCKPAKRALEKKINRRAALLATLLEQAPDLWSKAMTEIHSLKEVVNA